MSSILNLVPEDEREYLGDDLDLDYVAGAAADVASTLDRGGVAEVAFQPGDGTFYGLVFVSLSALCPARPRVVGGEEWGRRAVRGMLKGRDGDYPANGYLVAWVGHTCYPLRLGLRGGRSLHAGYVAEHWRTSLGSAASLALLFRAIAAEFDRLAGEAPSARLRPPTRTRGGGPDPEPAGTRFGCPKCGSTAIRAWYRESVAYDVPIVADEDGQPEEKWDEAGDADPTGDGDFEEFTCRDCGEVLLRGDLVPAKVVE